MVKLWFVLYSAIICLVIVLPFLFSTICARAIAHSKVEEKSSICLMMHRSVNTTAFLPLTSLASPIPLATLQLFLVASTRNRRWCRGRNGRMCNQHLIDRRLEVCDRGWAGVHMVFNVKFSLNQRWGVGSRVQERVVAEEQTQQGGGCRVPR